MQSFPELESLSETSDWIRRLARRLILDQHAADDVAQDAMLIALKRPKSPRAWLAGVVRKLARQKLRGDRRRLNRERTASKPEALPSTLALVEQLSVQREVQDLVLGLDEPYRTVLLLRYFKELSLDTIAQEQQVPISTVHSRERKALELLRNELDRAHGGDRGSWVLTLLPIHGDPSGGLVAGLKGIFAMSTASKLVAGGVAVAIAIWCMTTIGAAPETESPVAQANSTGLDGEQRSSSAVTMIASSVDHQARVSKVEPAPTVEPSESQAEAPITPDYRPVEGRVIDLSGFGVSGATIALGGGSQGWRKGSAPVSDGSGYFQGEIDVQLGEGHELSAENGSWVTVVSGRIGDRSAVTIVVSSPRTFAGRVVDADHGEPVANARVSIEIKPQLYRDLRLVGHEVHRLESWTTLTDDLGRFQLERVAGGTHLTINAHKQGHGSSSLEAPHSSSFLLELQLFNPAATYRGLVLNKSGSAVAGAHVSIGRGFVMSGSDGAFEVSGSHGEGNGKLIAIKQGYQPGYVNDLDSPDTPVIVYLGEEAKTIAGRVVNHEGEPLPGITVWIGELTAFEDECIEEVIRGAGVGTRGAVTNSAGEFELAGLLDREYVLRALDPYGLYASRTPSVRGGDQDVELVLNCSKEVTKVAGVVRSSSGEPMRGVHITPFRDMGSSWTDVPNPPGGGWSSAISDAEGRFELEPIACFGAHLDVQPSLFSRHEHFDLDMFEDKGAIEIILPVLCLLQIDLSHQPEFANRAATLDAQGESVEMLILESDPDADSESVDITNGKSNVIRVSDRAITLVLYDSKDNEVFRQDLHLDPKRLTVVRP